MELKVWVDGIQRVVCGVNGNTSCHDVVLALAVATNQTGRFTLIEKWRNNERLLSSSEKPVEVLSKWGEYANDVHFVLKRTVDINGNNSNLSNPSPSLKNVFEQQYLAKKTSQNNNNNVCIQSPKTTLQTSLIEPHLNSSSNGKSPQVSPQITALQKDSNRVTQITPTKSSKRDAIDHNFKTHDHKDVKKVNEQPMSGVHTSPVRGRLISSEERSKLRGTTPVMASKLSSDRFKDSLKAVMIANNKSKVLDEAMDVSKESLSSDKKYPLTTYEPSVRRKAAAVCMEPLSVEEKRLKEEVESKRKERDQLLAKASELDAEIAVYRHKIQVLTDRIKEEEHRIEREVINKEREEILEHENAISELKRQIEECEKEVDQQKKESESIQNEIRSVEEALLKKYSEMDDVMMDIRKENLNALSLETSAASILSPNSMIGSSPFVKLHSENLGSNHLNSLIGSKFYHRIGSTRKMMGSPRQLQTAVASKKNPQGVWV